MTVPVFMGAVTGQSDLSSDLHDALDEGQSTLNPAVDSAQSVVDPYQAQVNSLIDGAQSSEDNAFDAAQWGAQYALNPTNEPYGLRGWVQWFGESQQWGLRWDINQVQQWNNDITDRAQYESDWAQQGGNAWIDQSESSKLDTGQAAANAGYDKGQALTNELVDGTQWNVATQNNNWMTWSDQQQNGADGTVDAYENLVWSPLNSKTGNQFWWAPGTLQGYQNQVRGAVDGTQGAAESVHGYTQYQVDANQYWYVNRNPDDWQRWANQDVMDVTVQPRADPVLAWQEAEVDRHEDGVHGAVSHDRVHDATLLLGDANTHTVKGPVQDHDRAHGLPSVPPEEWTDDPVHRATFSLDRNWGLTRSTFQVISTTRPVLGLVQLDWHFDNVALAPNQSSPIVATGPFYARTGGATPDTFTFRPLTPGLHYLTLTATWNEDGTLTRDRVTSPIYVEDPTIALMPEVDQYAVWKPTGTEWLGSTLQGDPSEVVAAVQTTTDQVATTYWKPTVMIISDFIGPDTSLLNKLAIKPGDVQNRLAALNDPRIDLAAGFGPFNSAATTTGLGHPVTHVGKTLTQTLVQIPNLDNWKSANVIFVGALNLETGSLDRAVLRNALVYAMMSPTLPANLGLPKVDAIVWGLPSKAYVPAILANAMRPQLHVPQTPLVPLEPAGPLPVGGTDWAGGTAPMELQSVISELYQRSFLVGATPETANDFLDVLWAQRASLEPNLRPVVEAVRNDALFDHDLQSWILELSDKGVPFVVPSERCTDYMDQYMTVIGISHLAGTVTVADGNASGPDPRACRGPDRRAAAHGTGIHFVADPKPYDPDLLDAYRNVPVIPGVTTAPPTVAYVPNSLGAALRVAWKVAGIGTIANYFWPGKLHGDDYVGILAAKAEPAAGVPTWAQGAGYLPIERIDHWPLLNQFPRGSNVVFTPVHLPTGETKAIVQVFVTNPAFVDRTALLTPAGWNVTGDTDYRFFTTSDGRKAFQVLSDTEDGRLSVELESVRFQRLATDWGVATLTLSAHPDSTSDWFVPGLYSGTTWISTPNGILQLPFSVPVGTIFDTYRFLAPGTPVPKSFVCLAPPIDLLTKPAKALHELAAELGLTEICLYWTNTDEHGVARFYNPLPMLYEVVAFFDGNFELLNETGATHKAGQVYPHFREPVLIPAPTNVSVVQGWTRGTTDLVDDAASGGDPTQLDMMPGGPPTTVDLTLERPLAYIHMNLTAPVAVAVNWRYRDNMETDHIIPVPAFSVPEFALSVVNGILGDPVGGAFGTTGGLARLAPGELQQVLGTTQDAAKRGVHATKSTMDGLIGAVTSAAAPLNLQPDPDACSFGYGHARSPAIDSTVVSQVYRKDHGGLDPADVHARLESNADREAPWPDALTMRVRPTLDHLVGLSGKLPLCVAVYPFNVPEPNYAPTKITHEFDVFLEDTVLLVCVVTHDGVDCRALIPDPTGGTQIVTPPFNPLEDRPEELLNGDIAQALRRFQADPPGTARQTIDDAVTLPPKANLTAQGHVRLDYTVKTAGADAAYLYYIAIPNPLSNSGALDPLLGVLHEKGLDAGTVLNQIALGEEVPAEARDAYASVSQLVRDSMEDVLRSQPFIEITKPTFHLDAWWWTDSFVHNTINGAKGLVKTEAGTAGKADGKFAPAEAFWWISRPNIHREYFERGLRYWNATNLQPDWDHLVADGYPWSQPEYFENTMQFWDDEHVADAVPSQIHIHSPSTVHEQVEAGRQCTYATRMAGTIPLNSPITKQHCFGAFDFEEGQAWTHPGALNSTTLTDRWLYVLDNRSMGIYDPDGQFHEVSRVFLQVLDQVLAGSSDTWDVVWNQQLAPAFGSTANSAGIDLADLKWWDRDEEMLANRQIYSDLHTNSSYFLSDHHQACEEMSQFTAKSIPYATLDLHPRWKVDCPWIGGYDDAKAAWMFNRDAPNLTKPKLMDENGDPVGSLYAVLLQPSFYNGTFAIAWDAWNACRAGQSFAPYVCNATHPMQQAAIDLGDPISREFALTVQRSVWENRTLLQRELPFNTGTPFDEVLEWQELQRTLVTVTNNTLDWFGMDWRGWDAKEDYVTVPLPSNPDRWYGPSPTATEWDAFYLDKRFEAWDAAAPHPEEHRGEYGRFKQNMTRMAPLLRSWLEGDLDAVGAWYPANGEQEFLPTWLPAPGTTPTGNPFWTEVTGTDIPYAALGQLRPTDDDEEPRDANGVRVCDGWFWVDRCHNRLKGFDAGDLSAFAGLDGRDRKSKFGYFPQGVLFARSNAAHLLPAGVTAACWFDPAHTRITPLPHLEEFPLDVTMWNAPYRGGLHTHVEAGSGGDAEPVPQTPYGNFCTDENGDVLIENGQPVLARSEREYLNLSLPRTMNGGDPDLDRLPPKTTYRAEGTTTANVILAGVSTHLVPAEVRGLLQQVQGVVWEGLPDAIAQVPQPSDIAGVLKAAASGQPPSIENDLASPLHQFGRWTLAAGVDHAELMVLHTFDYPTGVQGVFFASTDDENWTLAPARGAPGFIGRSQDTLNLGTAPNVAFVDLSAYRGQSVRIAARMLGAGWDLAASRWTLHKVAVLSSGVNGAVAPEMAGWTGTTSYTATYASPSAATIAALPAGSTVLLRGGLDVPAGETYTFRGLDLVFDRCGTGLAPYCPLTVEGTLVLDGVRLFPSQGSPAGSDGVAEGVPVSVRGGGRLECAASEVGGLAHGVLVTGASARFDRCWFVKSGFLGILGLFAQVEVTNSVFANEMIGVYTLASEVALEKNVFLNMTRAAGVFDDAWGIVRDNDVYHTRQAGFLVKGPRANADLILTGNRIEETGIGIGVYLSPEAGVEPQGPVATTPLAARSRVQGNRLEWNTLSALVAGPLTGAAYYGNVETHNNVGLRVYGLSPVTANYNTLYSEVEGWIEPNEFHNPTAGFFGDAVRKSPADDGNLWAGFWQSSDLAVLADATKNYWGPQQPRANAYGLGEPTSTGVPAPKVMGNVPLDLVVRIRDPTLAGRYDASWVTNNLVNYTDWLTAPDPRPLRVGLTAPGFAGGLEPSLTVDGQAFGGGDAVSPLTADRRVGTDLDLADMAIPPLDQVLIGSQSPRVAHFTWHAGPEVASFKVVGTFTGSPTLADGCNAPDLAQLRDRWGPQVPVADASTTTFTTPEIGIATNGATRGDHAFTFDCGRKDLFVDWRIMSYRLTGSPQEAAADGIATKDTRVYNSLTAPLFLDLVPLVDDLAFDAVSSTLASRTLTTRLAQDLPADPAALLADNLPLSFRPDGTLAFEGTPSLMALAADQDPVTHYEFRYRFTDEGARVWHPLGDGLSTQRVHALPPLVEGDVLEVQGRALDASGLVSPWTAMRLLQDRSRPEMTLADDCLAGVGDGVEFLATDLSGSGEHAGIDKVRFHAVRVGGTGPPVSVIDATMADADGDTYSGTWTFPTTPANYYVDGAVYLVTARSFDRAGHASDLTPALRVAIDLDAPTGVLRDVLQKLNEAGHAADKFVGLTQVPGGLLPIALTATDLGCGIDTILVEKLVDGVLPWQSVTAVSGNGAATKTVDGPVLDLAPLPGHTLNVRVTITDRAGNAWQDETGPVSIDLAPPVPTWSASFPVCLNGPSQPYTWGADEALPVASVSGLRDVVLRWTGPSSWTNASGDLAGALSWNRTDRFSPSQDGTYTVTQEARDRAGHVVTVPRGTVKVDRSLPTVVATFQERESVVKALTDAAVGHYPLEVDATIVDPSFSCLLEWVKALLRDSAGNEVVLYNRTGLTSATHTIADLVVDLDALIDVDTGLDRSADFDGESARLVVRAGDRAGNVRETTSNAFLIDTTPPSLAGLAPSALPQCIGAAGYGFDWTSLDPTPNGGTGSGLVADVLEYSTNGGATWTTALATHPGTWVPPLGTNLTNAQFRLRARDAADHAVTVTLAGSSYIDLAMGPGGQPAWITPLGLGWQCLNASNSQRRDYTFIHDTATVDPDQIEEIRSTFRLEVPVPAGDANSTSEVISTATLTPGHGWFLSQQQVRGPGTAAAATFNLSRLAPGEGLDVDISLKPGSPAACGVSGEAESYTVRAGPADVGSLDDSLEQRNDQLYIAASLTKPSVSDCVYYVDYTIDLDFVYETYGGGPRECDCTGWTHDRDLVEYYWLRQDFDLTVERKTFPSGAFSAWSAGQEVPVAYLPDALDVTESGTDLELWDESVSEAIPIGFSFNFYGTDYDEVWVSDNGFVTFSNPWWNTGCCAGQQLPDAAEPNNLIAGYWEDLDPSSGGSIFYETLGTAPERKFVVQWKDVPHYCGFACATDSPRASFRIVLEEGSNDIEVQFDGATADTGNHVTGIENADGSIGSVYKYGAYSERASAVAFATETSSACRDPGPDLGATVGGGYKCLAKAYAFEDISATGTAFAFWDDDVSPPVPLGFDFIFYGGSYEEAYVSSNGFLSFDADVPNGCCSGQSFPSPSDPNNVIAGYWEDLMPGIGGSVTYETRGHWPFQRFIVQWTDVPHYWGGNEVTFQIVLYETSNDIVVNFQEAPSDGGTHATGIEHYLGTFGLNYQYGDYGASQTSVRFTRGAGGSCQSTEEDAYGYSCLTGVPIGPDTTRLMSGASLRNFANVYQAVDYFRDTAPVGHIPPTIFTITTITTGPVFFTGEKATDRLVGNIHDLDSDVVRTTETTTIDYGTGLPVQVGQRLCLEILAELESLDYLTMQRT